MPSAERAVSLRGDAADIDYGKPGAPGQAGSATALLHAVVVGVVRMRQEVHEKYLPKAQRSFQIGFRGDHRQQHARRKQHIATWATSLDRGRPPTGVADVRLVANLASLRSMQHLPRAYDAPNPGRSTGAALARRQDRRGAQGSAPTATAATFKKLGVIKEY